MNIEPLTGMGRLLLTLVGNDARSDLVLETVCGGAETSESTNDNLSGRAVKINPDHRPSAMASDTYGLPISPQRLEHAHLIQSRFELDLIGTLMQGWFEDGPFSAGILIGVFNEIDLVLLGIRTNMVKVLRVFKLLLHR
jgi:hypothetical protein